MSNKPVAVILSGAGVYDGSEISEAVLTLLALDQNGTKYQCLAPNIKQNKVINHLDHSQMNETRNVLVESARIARGDIKDLATQKAEDYSAVILPGGFGAALNLSDFAINQDKCSVNPDVAKFMGDIINQNKKAGFICIAPAMIPRLYPKGTKLTIGNDQQTKEAIEKMGGSHIDCTVENIVIDEDQNVISTPAYMLATSVSEAYAGIKKLVDNFK